jgi:3-oxoacyl-[acyl-carrier protein] reductase
MLLHNKTAIITGASRGIGKAIAEVFAQNGANLYLIARDEEKLEALKASLEKNYKAQVSILPTDLRSIGAIKEAVNAIKKDKVSLDILVNNAGVMADAVLQVIKPETVQDLFATNVYSVLYLTQMTLPLFLKKRKGSVINISSIIGTHGNIGQSVYGASKSAVIGFTLSVSKELAPLNIRVNALAPGFIDTDMIKKVDDRFYRKNKESIGMQRIGKPEDVANAALFLASDLSEYITGQVIGVDGGMII